jgi:ArsR family transcriptional regulator
MPATTATLNLPPPLHAPAPDFDALAGAASALGDPQRLNLLRLLRHSAYAVSELACMLDMSQPALSHHLKRLFEAGLVRRQRQGNSSYYRRGPACTTSAFAGLLAALDALPLAQVLAARRRQVLADRQQQSQRFFDEHAAEFAGLKARISNPEAYGPVLLEQVEALGSGAARALEIGPGDGEVLGPLAERYGRVIALDHSERMLANTASALPDKANIEFRQQPFEALAAAADFDLVIAAMVLHHSSDPAGFIAHAARCLQDDGLLLVAELCSHDQVWAQEACGDRWLGFEPADLEHWARSAGLTPLAAEFLAQRNGFRIQIHAFRRASTAAPDNPN